MRHHHRSHHAVRIIAGRLRGSRLQVAERAGLRPTPDRVRETVFNWLAPWIEGARCLDLFAGTGALGIEALSRGAAQCTFLETAPDLVRALRDNLARLQVDHAEVVQCDALAWLARPGEAVDVAFVDPPFAHELWNPVLHALEQGHWLRGGAFVHVEAPATLALTPPPNWQVHREGRAGAVRFVLYRRAAADPLS